MLVEVLSQSDKPQVVSWGATRPFYHLADKLRAQGAEFSTPEIPDPNNYWTVSYLGSKCGFRQLCGRLSLHASDIRIPKGYVCADITLAAEIVNSGRFMPGGVVVKANNGVGGYGTLVYSPQRFGHHLDIKTHLQMNARLMPIFSKGPIIVEAYIEGKRDLQTGSPSIQGLIDPQGRAFVTCLASQIVEPRGRYVGAMLGSGVFSAELRDNLVNIGLEIGHAAASLGYRGIFNIDSVLDRDGNVYCVELNARRTSVKYIIDIAAHLFGPSFESSISIISNERFQSKSLVDRCYLDIRQSLAPLLFPMNGNPRGILISIASSLNHYSRMPQLGFLALGDDPEMASSIFLRAKEILS
jgi:hypothetical protein